MLEKIELKNFSKFSDLQVQFSPRINIIIGENGTGKSQLLKAAYIANVALNETLNEAEFTKRLCGVYKPADNNLSNLIKHGTRANQFAEIEASYAGGQQLHAKFKSRAPIVQLVTIKDKPQIGAPLFLPTKEVLSLLQGIKNKTSDIKTIEAIFDSTYLDLCKKLIIEPTVVPNEMIETNPRFGAIYVRLVESMGGRFNLELLNENLSMTFEPGHYETKREKRQHELNTRMLTSFVANKGESVSANMAAEGIRKLGLLQLLLKNQQLNPGETSTLFWDEPETNMNPKLMRLLVEVLLELSRNGQQIVLATHDYVLLKWFDLLCKASLNDHIKYHALFNKDGNICSQSANDYRQLSSNAIANTFTELYDEEIMRSFGEA